MMAFGIALLIFVIIAVQKGFVIVPEGYEYTLERLGKFERILKPGFHIVIPFFDMIGAKINVKEQTINFPQKEFITEDEYTVLIDGTITFQITDVVKASYSIQDLYNSLLNSVYTHLQRVVENRTKDNVFSKKSAIGYKLTESVGEENINFGVKIIHVDIQNISQPSLDYFEKPKNYYGK